MAEHSYTGVMGKAGPYALLLGALALPATVLSQSNNINGDPESMPPAQPAMGYGGGGYGAPPARGPGNDGHDPMSGAVGGFMGHRQQSGRYNAPGYGSGMGHGPYGPSPFDNPPGPSRQPASEYTAGSGSYGEAMKSPPSAYIPSFGPGASPFSPPAQGAPAGQGTMARQNPGASPNPGQGMLPQLSAPHPCGGKPFMSRGGMQHGGMRTGADISILLQMPGLRDEQREKLYTIMDQLRRAHWELMGKNMDYSAELRKLYGAEEPDAKAIGAVYGKIFDVKREMIESGIEAKQKARAVLTEEQRKQLQSWGKAG